MQTAVIRLALIGGSDHRDAYRAALPHLDGANITVVMDADQDAALKTRGQLGAQSTAGSWDQLFDNEPGFFDAIVAHTPIARRCEVVQRAAAAGKHVFVETPLAVSIEEAERAIAACKSAGVQLMVAQPLRFMPYQRTVREKLESGKLGTPGLLRVHHWHADNAESADSGSLQTILNLTIREIDIACWLFAAAPNFVSAQALSENTTPQGLQLHLGFPSGGMALIDCTRTLPAGSDPYYALTLIGSTGAAYADDHHNTNLWWRDGSTFGLRVGQGEDFFTRQLEEFVDAVRHGRAPSCTGEDARRALSVAHAALASLESRSTATLGGDRDEFR